MFSQIKDRQHIEHNFHFVAKVMPRGGTAGCLGSLKLSVGICDGAPSPARSSFFLIVSPVVYWGFVFISCFVLCVVPFLVFFSFISLRKERRSLHFNCVLTVV